MHSKKHHQLKVSANWSNLALLPQSLRKHAYSNIQECYHKKMKTFRRKILVVFIFLLKTQIVGSNEYLQTMFVSRNKKINVYPCKPVLLYKSGFYRGQNYLDVFSWCWARHSYSGSVNIPIRKLNTISIAETCFVFFLAKSQTRGPWWLCNAYLSIIALREPDP